MILKNKSRQSKKLTYGVGVNDFDGEVYHLSDSGIRRPKPFYAAWKSMLMRGYSDSFKIKRPTYANCSSCKEWLSLSAFKIWFDSNHVEGWHLDKDLMIDGNKIYSPEACRYIPASLNMLLTNHASARGRYPQGVTIDKRRGSFAANLSVHGKLKWIGNFATVERAEAAYRSAKRDYVLSEIDSYRGLVDDGLLNSVQSRYNDSISTGE